MRRLFSWLTKQHPSTFGFCTVRFVDAVFFVALISILAGRDLGKDRFSGAMKSMEKSHAVKRAAKACDVLSKFLAKQTGSGSLFYVPQIPGILVTASGKCLFRLFPLK